MALAVESGGPDSDSRTEARRCQGLHGAAECVGQHAKGRVEAEEGTRNSLRLCNGL
jgi:hypothetical protein